MPPVSATLLRTSSIACLSLCLTLLAGTVKAGEHAGVVDSLNGEVTLLSGVSKKRVPLSVGTAIDEGDTVTTGSNAEVLIRMDDGGVISLRGNTSMRIDEYLADGSEQEHSYFSLLKGAMRSVTGWIGKAHPHGYRINTTTATIGIRGTDHEVILLENGSDNTDEAGTYDIVHEGATYMRTEQGEVDALPGLPAFLALGRPGKPLQLQHNPAFLQARRILLDRALEHIRDQVRDQLPIMHDQRKKGLLKNIFEDKERRRLEKMQDRRTRKAGREEERRQARTEKRVDRRDNSHDKMQGKRTRDKPQKIENDLREWRKQGNQGGHGPQKSHGRGRSGKD